MKISKWAVAMVTVLAIGPTGTILAQHWGYEGEAGPQNWGKLDPNFGVCASGKNQSPIDLKGFIEADMKPLKLDYKAGIADIAHHGHGIADMVNNGHTVQVNHAPGSTLSVDGITFELKQFHFHSPSENKINGKQFPLEGHLVHADKDGNLAVLAVMFQEGAANTLLAKLWEKMPNKAGEKSAPATGLSVFQLLPNERDYYRFNGSLTTPPCSEGVRWFVIKKPGTASRAQIQQFSKAIGFANNRPIQSTNARSVLQ
jgi:carbonic anhydrase